MRFNNVARASSLRVRPTQARGMRYLASSSEMTRRVRKAEGLELRTNVLRGNAPSQIEIEIEDVTFELDLLHGQKTGFYLDQKDNYGTVCRIRA